MPARKDMREAVKFMKNVDDILEILTGKRLKDIGAKVIDVYGEELGKRLDHLSGLDEENNGLTPELKAAYLTLHCRPSADDMVIKGKYRTLMKQYHPDVSRMPDEEACKKVIEAYNLIMKTRHPQEKS